MSRSTKLAVLVILAIAAAYAVWQVARPSRDAAASLTPMPGVLGFEPGERPKEPVLRSKAADGLDVDFGYRTGGTCCGYTLVLAFPPGAPTGTATIVARRDGRTTRTEMPAARRWDEPRKSYAVALSGPSGGAAPALCIKAVIGPSLDALDLADGTLCAAQRDAGGGCHPETLACGLLRPH